MYTFIWLHLITPACFWKLEFPSNCSGNGENIPCSLQAFLLQKLLRIFSATFKSPADFHLQLLSCSAGQWIKELRVTGAAGTRREGLEPVFSSWSLVPFGWMQQCDQSCQPCSNEDFDKADSHTLAAFSCLSTSLPKNSYMHYILEYFYG